MKCHHGQSEDKIRNDSERMGWVHHFLFKREEGAHHEHELLFMIWPLPKVGSSSQHGLAGACWGLDYDVLTFDLCLNGTELKIFGLEFVCFADLHSEGLKVVGEELRVSCRRCMGLCMDLY